MGATPNLGLPWPELPSQADGPAAFQALATATENKMSNYVTRNSWGNDMATFCPTGTQVVIFSQDVAAACTGWCWFDVDVTITVGDPAGGGAIPSAAGQLILSGQNLSQELRRLRWHTRARQWILSCGGGAAMAVPASLSVINVTVVMSVDSSSWAGGAAGYTVNAGLTQFGAAR